jgi:pilus assembly protein CpaE
MLVGSHETEEALEHALATGLPETPVGVVRAQSFARADAVARGGRADIIAVEMFEDLDHRLTALARLTTGGQETPVVVIYDPLRLPDGVTENRLYLDAVRAGARDFLRMPLPPAEVGDIVRRLLAGRDAGALLEQEGELVAVISPKGGVGKSTVAVNVAAALAERHPDEVALVDASLQTGTAAHLLDLAPERSLADAAEAGDRLDGDLLDSIMVVHPATALRLLATPDDVTRAARLTEEGLTNVLAAVRERYRYVVVDTFPLVNSVNLAVIDLADRLILVVEATVPTLRETRRFLELLGRAEVDLDRVHVVVNRYAGGAGSVALDLVEKTLGRPIGTLLPLDPDVPAAGNEGRVCIQRYRRHAFSRRVRRLADLIDGAGARRGFFASLFGGLFGGGAKKNGAVAPEEPKAPEEPLPTVLLDEEPVAPAPAPRPRSQDAAANPAEEAEDHVDSR